MSTLCCIPPAVGFSNCYCSVYERYAVAGFVCAVTEGIYASPFSHPLEVSDDLVADNQPGVQRCALNERALARLILIAAESVYCSREEALPDRL